MQKFKYYLTWCINNIQNNIISFEQIDLQICSAFNLHSFLLCLINFNFINLRFNYIMFIPPGADKWGNAVAGSASTMSIDGQVQLHFNCILRWPKRRSFLVGSVISIRIASQLPPWQDMPFDADRRRFVHYLAGLKMVQMMMMKRSTKPFKIPERHIRRAFVRIMANFNWIAIIAYIMNEEFARCWWQRSINTLISSFYI